MCTTAKFGLESKLVVGFGVFQACMIVGQLVAAAVGTRLPLPDHEPVQG